MNDAARVFVARCGLLPQDVERASSIQKVPTDILLGLIMTESAGDAGAMRYEKNFSYLHAVAPHAKMFKWTEDTEEALQKFSWGLCQIMLATARWRGFSFHPTRLLEPVVGLTWGAHHLHELFLQYKDWPSAISAYNQGSPRKNLLTGRFKNQKYVDTVLRHARVFRGEPNV